MNSQSVMFDDPEILPTQALLATRHYLGPISRGDVYRDQYGLMVFANPSSRRLPQQRWLELIRWCLTSSIKDAGSRQWASAERWLRQQFPYVTTVVSYSDPSHGRTGALYRACNWRWAPTWHRLRTPPTGNGNWGNGQQDAKDRWVALLACDAERESLLCVKDESVLRRMPWASYREPSWHGQRASGGGADYKRWRMPA